MNHKEQQTYLTIIKHIKYKQTWIVNWRSKSEHTTINASTESPTNRASERPHSNDNATKQTSIQQLSSASNHLLKPQFQLT